MQNPKMHTLRYMRLFPYRFTLTFWKTTIALWTLSILNDETTLIRSSKKATIFENLEITFFSFWLIKSSEGDVIVSESTCECNFHSCMSLPCRHIFFFRKHKNMSSFDQCLVEPRWTKTTYFFILLCHKAKRIRSKMLCVIHQILVVSIQVHLNFLKNNYRFMLQEYSCHFN
jgi:hypothetical protein